MDNNLEITKRIQGQVTILDIKGVLNFSAKGYLAKCIEDLDQKGMIKLLLNFSQATAIHTTGLGVLVSIYKEIVAKNGHLKMTDMPPDIFDIFQVTRLIRIFEIYENEETALQSFS